MEPGFWHERWQSGEIGFHQPDVNVDLKQHWPTLALASSAGVFAPLCGKSLDLVWLRERGHRLVGVELSQLAVQQFFDSQQLEPRRTLQGALECWEAGGYRLYCGDFFELTAQDLGGCSAVFDRAALIALPAAMRQRYARHLGALLAPGTQTLLVTMSYPEEQMTPPPHSVSESEVRRLYATVFEVRLLASRDSLQDEPRLRARGLQSLQEQSYLLRRR